MNVTPTSAAGLPIKPIPGFPRGVKDLTGKRIGSLKVLSFTGVKKATAGNGISSWDVQCMICDHIFNIRQPRLVIRTSANKCARCR